jgi:hypothetical protein
VTVPAATASPLELSDRASLTTWAMVLGALLGAFMAVLNIQITNASLLYIAGLIGTGADNGARISTANLIGEIIVIPLIDYLSRVFSGCRDGPAQGRRRARRYRAQASHGHGLRRHVCSPRLQSSAFCSCWPPDCCCSRGAWACSLPPRTEAGLFAVSSAVIPTPVIDLYLDRVNSWFGRRRCGTISVEAAARTSGAPVCRSTPARRGSGSETGECAFVHSLCRDFCREQFGGYSLAQLSFRPPQGGGRKRNEGE